MVLDPQGRVLFSNGGLCRLLRRSGAELMHSALFTQHLAPADRDLLALLYPDGAQASPFPGEFQSELLTSDGQSRHVFWHAVVWRDGGGRLRGPQYHWR